MARWRGRAAPWLGSYKWIFYRCRAQLIDKPRFREGDGSGFPQKKKLDFVPSAFDAKNRLGQLLDLVEQGEEVTITRHGKEVARIVPARSRPARDVAHAATGRIRKRAEALKLGPFDWAEWKVYRDDGRP